MADPVQVAVRFGLYVVLGVLFGLPLFALYGVDRAVRTALPLRRLIVGGALLGLALSMLGLAVLAASMAGVPLIEVNRETLAIVATMPGVGTAWLIRVAALFALALAAMLSGRSGGLTVAAAILGAIALGSLAATGHTAVSEGVAGSVHLAADIAHLLSAGAWLGALAGLLLLIVRPPESGHLAVAHSALAGFATAGTVVVGALVVSGVANGWFIIGTDILALGTSTYGRLLLVKLGLFAVMLALAGTHRFRMTPALGRALDSNPATARRWLRTSLAIEAGIGVGILGIVAWLGLLQPNQA